MKDLHAAAPTEQIKIKPNNMTVVVRLTAPQTVDCMRWKQKPAPIQQRNIMRLRNKMLKQAESFRLDSLWTSDTRLYWLL